MIGEILMDKLKDLDPVAYVRFASVYREFKDVNTFMNELKKCSDEFVTRGAYEYFRICRKQFPIWKGSGVAAVSVFVGTQDTGVKKTPLDTGISALRSGENFSL